MCIVLNTYRIGKVRIEYVSQPYFANPKVSKMRLKKEQYSWKHFAIKVKLQKYAFNGLFCLIHN